VGESHAGSRGRALQAATLTEGGGDKVVAAAPGHVAEVHRLVLDPLTKAQALSLDPPARGWTGGG
jgi:hypothetical protein